MPEKRFQLLLVDLTTKNNETVEVTGEVKNFLGGRSLGTKLLWENIPPMADPLGDQNVLYIGNKTTKTMKTPAIRTLMKNVGISQYSMFSVRILIE